MKSWPKTWHYVVNVKLTVKILSIFMAFLEIMDFTTIKLNSHWGSISIFIQKYMHSQDDSLMSMIWMFYENKYFVKTQTQMHETRILLQKKKLYHVEQYAYG